MKFGRDWFLHSLPGTRDPFKAALESHASRGICLMPAVWIHSMLKNTGKIVLEGSWFVQVFSMVIGPPFPQQLPSLCCVPLLTPTPEKTGDAHGGRISLKPQTTRFCRNIAATGLLVDFFLPLPAACTAASFTGMRWRPHVQAISPAPS